MTYPKPESQAQRVGVKRPFAKWLNKGYAEQQIYISATDRQKDKTDRHVYPARLD